MFFIDYECQFKVFFNVDRYMSFICMIALLELESHKLQKKIIIIIVII